MNTNILEGKGLVLMITPPEKAFWFHMIFLLYMIIIKDPMERLNHISP